ncbi:MULTISPECIES: hypothetical protein [unclassified Sphingobium]|uniref:hypothetical protein n=1 Tax=unclassified Sphingobium TaxID=2611147 RepID=UPI0022254862|nr:MULTISPECIES: hypothetical protein [unclassified Sphingobium]MCW2349301.1 glycosyltransferase involved in cell wall biosynthesis [Sphingobium sp. B12D2B]MCW2368403.1 glycosyltransferase involved in cell wall biosynthesis [Sphingobium sp. B11D3D]
MPDKTSSFDHRFKTIALACELNGYQRDNSIKRAQSAEIQIVSVGSIEPRKNHLALLEVFQRASKVSTKRLSLRLVGKASSAWPTLAEEVAIRVKAISDCAWLTDVDVGRVRAGYHRGYSVGTVVGKPGNFDGVTGKRI